MTVLELMEKLKNMPSDSMVVIGEHRHGSVIKEAQCCDLGSLLSDNSWSSVDNGLSGEIVVLITG